MKTNDAIRAAALAALVATPFANAPAAGPFQVRRATTAEAVSAAPSLATIETSPYDGDVASFANETSYYYAVYDAAGAVLDISVQTNPATRVIRIGFDDANAASAAVDPRRWLAGLLDHHRASGRERRPPRSRARGRHRRFAPLARATVRPDR